MTLVVFCLSLYFLTVGYVGEFNLFTSSIHFKHFSVFPGQMLSIDRYSPVFAVFAEFSVFAVFAEFSVFAVFAVSTVFADRGSSGPWFALPFYELWGVLLIQFTDCAENTTFNNTVDVA